MSISLEQLREFIVFCNYLNFTKAAQALYTTQSNLSKKIRKLESETELTLIAHEGNSLQLTKSGAHFLERSKEIVEDYDAMIEHCHQVESTSSIQFLASVPYYADYTSQKYYNEINRIHEFIPGCTVRYITPTRFDLEEAILAKEIDTCIYYRIENDWKPHNEQIMAKKLCDVRLAVWCDKSNKLAEKDCLSIEDLDGVAVMRPDDVVVPLSSVVDELRQRSGHTIKSRLVHSSNQTEFFFRDPRDAVYILPLSSKDDSRLLSVENRVLIPLEQKALCSSYIIYHKDNEKVNLQTVFS